MNYNSIKLSKKYFCYIKLKNKKFKSKYINKWRDKFIIKYIKKNSLSNFIYITSQ